jgi:hypothetical protein
MFDYEIPIKCLACSCQVHRQKPMHCASGNNSPGSRVYQLVLKSMKLLPDHSYTKKAMLRATAATKKMKPRSDAEGDDHRI